MNTRTQLGSWNDAKRHQTEFSIRVNAITSGSNKQTYTATYVAQWDQLKKNFAKYKPIWRKI